MPLDITPASEVIIIKTIIGLIFGQPGVGKTSTFFTCASPLLFDFDKGAHRSQFRRDIVQVSTWTEIADLDPHRDFAGYETIGIDTTGRCLDALAAEIIRDNPKAKKSDGSLSMMGWGKLKTSFLDWLKCVRSAGLDVVLLAHDKEERKGDDRIVRPDIQGGSYAEIFKQCDFIGYNHMSGGHRILDFNPTDEWVGKNPGAFEPIQIPDFNGAPEFLARILSETKAKLGQLSEGSAKISEEVDFWRSLIGDVSGVDNANHALAHLLGEGGKDLSEPATIQVKALLWQRAKETGLVYSYDTEGFVPKQETETEKVERLRKQAFDEPEGDEAQAPDHLAATIIDDVSTEETSLTPEEAAEATREHLAYIKKRKGEQPPPTEVVAPESDQINGDLSTELPPSVEGFDLTQLKPGDVVDFLKAGKPGDEPARVMGKVDRVDGESLLVVPIDKTRPVRIPLKPSHVQLVEQVSDPVEPVDPLLVGTGSATPPPSTNPLPTKPGNLL